MQSVSLKMATGRDFALVLLGSLAISLFGHISIPLWFTPVPLATQNGAVLLVALLLGSRRGAAATFAFLSLGAMGLPVLSQGLGGFALFLGPTGGYLIGYLIAAYVTGLIAEKKKGFLYAALALAAGNGIIYLLGASYLATFVGLDRAFALGIAPFLIGDAAKFVISLKIAKWAGWKRSAQCA